MTEACKRCAGLHCGGAGCQERANWPGFDAVLKEMLRIVARSANERRGRRRHLHRLPPPAPPAAACTCPPCSALPSTFAERFAHPACATMSAAEVRKLQASIFRRGQKAELFDGSGGGDEADELAGKLQELHGIWALERSGWVWVEAGA